jgi:hypothetical protein
MLFLYLFPNIWYQSSRSWGFTAASETPWNFRYKFSFGKFQKEILGGYLVDRANYVWLKYQLLGFYTFEDISCGRSGS